MIFWAQLVFIVLALILTFIVGVWLGVDRTPPWFLYASMFVMVMGGGAAINLILFGVK